MVGADCDEVGSACPTVDVTGKLAVAGNGELMVVTRVGSLSLDTSFLGAEVDAGVGCFAGMDCFWVSNGWH